MPRSWYFRSPIQSVKYTNKKIIIYPLTSRDNYSFPFTNALFPQRIYGLIGFPVVMVTLRSL